MPAPISASDKREFGRLWNLSKMKLARLAGLLPVGPEKTALAVVTMAVDNAIPDWQAGRLDDGSFTQLYKKISDANLAIGDLAKKRQAIGISDAVESYQEALDSDLNPIVADFWDVRAITVAKSEKKSPLPLILGVLATLAIVTIVVSNSKE